MVPLLQQEKDTAGAIKLIKKQLAMQPNSKLYSLLGDILSSEKDQAKAVEYYTIAIKLVVNVHFNRMLFNFNNSFSMDPTNKKAVAGLIAMGQTSSKSAPKSETQPGAASYQNSTLTDEGVLFNNAVSTSREALENESDSEAMWSDLEIDEQIVTS